MKKRFKVVLDGEVYEVEVEVEEPANLESLLQAFKAGVVKRVSAEVSGAKAIEGAIPSPITGRVVEVKVKPGDRIDRDTVVVVLEAMKTRVEVKATREGIVKEVLVSEGITVKQGQPLLFLQ